MEYRMQLTKQNEMSVLIELEPWCRDCKFFAKEQHTAKRWYNGIMFSETPSLEETTISCKYMSLCKDKYHSEVASEKL